MKKLTGKIKGINLAVRLVLVAVMVIATFGFIAQPVFATTTVSEIISPNPTAYLLNTGGFTELIWWTIFGYTTTPSVVRHIIQDPTGAIVHQDDFPLVVAPHPGIPPVIYNPEDTFTGTVNTVTDNQHFAGSGLSADFPITGNHLVLYWTSAGPVYHWVDVGAYTLSGSNFTLAIDPGFTPTVGATIIDQGEHLGDGNPTYAHKWDVPAGAKPGDYVSTVYYFSVEVLNGRLPQPPPYPPEGEITWEQQSGQTFWVRQPLTIFKYHDLNGNGTYDEGEGEYGLDSWNFSASGTGYSASGWTTGGGYYDLPVLSKSGDYIITETLKPGWLNTDPGAAGNPGPLQKTITVPTGIDPAHPVVMFGNQELGTLKIFKYHDENYNRQFDPGEEGLPGWNFSVSGLPGYYYTDSNGFITISNLVPGEYTVTENTPLPTGWINTDPGDPPPYDKPVMVVAGETAQVDFGNKPMGHLTIFKYHDVNKNGQFDAGELGLAGWNFTVISDVLGLIGEYETNAQGYIEIDTNAGGYTVTEVDALLGQGWINTDPGGTAPYHKHITVPTGGSIQVDFGNKPMGHLTIFKYHDVNKNGQFDAGELGLAGWNFTVTSDVLGLIGEYETNAQGYIEIDTNAGGYTVTEVDALLGQGWINTDPGGTAPYHKHITVPTGGSIQVDFGNKPMGHLTIFKYHDVNKNGQFDAGELGLAGWNFTVTSDVLGLIGEYETNAQGYIEIDTNAGGYTVTEVDALLGQGWINTDPGGTAPYHKHITVPTGGSIQVDFGNKPMGHLTIFKYHDVNKNGQFDAGELGLAGWNFTVISDVLGLIGEYETNAQGYIEIDTNAGGYTVTEVDALLGQGWINTDPGGTAPYHKHITVPTGGSIQVDFGNKPMGHLIIFKYHDVNKNGQFDAGELGLAGWNFTVTSDVLGLIGEYETNAQGYIEIDTNAGGYTVTEVDALLGQGWINTDPGGTAPYHKHITVPTGGSIQVDFGNKPMGHLTIFKYHDVNKNGQFDAGELGLAGWNFTVTSDVLGLIGEYETNAQGYIEIDTNAGGYTVTEVDALLGQGWINTDPGGTAPYHKHITVPTGGSIQVDFGNKPMGHLTIFKYHDVNKNGQFDAGELGLAGWNFTVISDVLGLIGEYETNAQGYIEIDTNAGDYTVTEVDALLGQGWINTDPGGTAPYHKHITVPLNDSVQVDFGNKPMGHLTIFKYHDVNKNGQFDAGELGLAGWNFTVTSDVLGLIGEYETNAQGYIEIDTNAGGYTVTEVDALLGQGWINTDPGGTAPYHKHITVPTGGSIQVDFGNKPMGHLTIFKYHDRNKNGQYDSATDEGLAGWNFTVTSDVLGLIGEYETNAQGYIEIDTNAGGYTVTEVDALLGQGWINTDPGGTPPYHKHITVPTGGSIQVDFGNKPMGTLKIFKYHDENYNHQWDSGEEPLEGWNFTVTSSESGFIGEYETNADGLIEIDTNAGRYTITEVTPLPDGWINTDPGDGTYQKTAIVPTGGSIQVDFGNKPMGHLIIFKYHDVNKNGQFDAGELGLAGWNFTVTSDVLGLIGEYETNAQGYIEIDTNAGGYTVTEVDALLGQGWINTDPGGTAPYHKHITVPTGGSIQVDFGNKPMGHLTIFKYHDVNKNGQFDAGELGLAGWNFTVISDVLGFIGEYETNAQGLIEIDTNAGGYTVTEVDALLGQGWINTDPGGTAPYHKHITIPTGGSIQVDFGNKPMGHLTIFKYHDVNKNGQFDAGELGLAGWNFTVTSDVLGLIGEYETNASGYIEIDTNAGGYTVTEVDALLGQGWINTDPGGTAPYHKHITVPTGGSVQVDFGNKPMGHLIIFKYHDVNYNHQWDSGEEPLEGWNFTITSSVLGFIGEYETNAQGLIEIDTNAGDYTITEVTPLPTGWINTDPGGTAPYHKHITVPTGGSVQVDFGNKPMGHLIIFKYHDVNHNHQWDSGEEPLEGWNFNITSSVLGFIGEYETNAQGLIEIDTNAGDYTITEVTPLPTGWINTDPGGTAPYHKHITVPTGGSVQVDFGNKPMGHLTIFKYHDVNKNGQFDAGELGLAGWNFTVTSDVLGLIGEYETNAQGYIEIDTNAGGYTVTEVDALLGQGWINTDPGGTAPYHKHITVPTGGSVQVDFGNKPMGHLIIFKYHDANYNHQWDPGEEGLKDWDFTVTSATLGLIGEYTTDEDGLIDVFTNVGDYTITEDTPLPNGWINTDPGDGTYQKTASVPLNGSVQVNFGNKPMGHLIIFKYFDQNGSHGWDTGEEGLEGWNFTVTSPTLGFIGDYKTNHQGLIDIFTNAGEYTITEVTPLPDKWFNTDPGDGTYQKTAVVPEGGSEEVDFGNNMLGELIIEKRDLETGEIIDLPGVTFSIQPNPYTGDIEALIVVDNDPAYDSDPRNGYIDLQNVLLGTYTVTEIAAPAGYEVDHTPQTVILNVDTPVVTVVVEDSPPKVPASTNLGLGLLVAGFAGAMIYLVRRRAKGISPTR